MKIHEDLDIVKPCLFLMLKPDNEKEKRALDKLSMSDNTLDYVCYNKLTGCYEVELMKQDKSCSPISCCDVVRFVIGDTVKHKQCEGLGSVIAVTGNRVFAKFEYCSIEANKSYFIKERS